MKDEIKEILENVFDLAIAECPSWDIEKIKKAKDYITNLQEKNKKLKELCNKYEEEHKTTFEEWKKTINIIDELEKYLIDKQELTCGCGITKDYLYAYENVLDKLNELKGDNK